MKRIIGICGLSMAVLALQLGCSAKSGTDEQATKPPAIPDQVATATIFPQPAHSNNPLTVKLPGRGTNPADYAFTWRCNDVVIEAADGPTLDPSRFRRGDLVSVEATPRDPAATGDTHQASIRIVNTPPKIMSASTFMGTKGRPEIFVNVKSADADGDPITYSYRWFKNGQPIDGANGAELDPTLTGRGDRIHAEIVATDGEESTPAYASEAIVIENHAPRISSTPAGPTPTDVTFHYKVVADDADADPLTYELIAAPAGMSVDDEGNVVWVLPTPEEREGKHTIQIKVSDPNGGAAIQQFSLSFVKRDQDS